MIATVGTEIHFDAAHYLPNYNGKCKNMHGHTWHVTAEVTGTVDPISAMVIDLSILKAIIKSYVDKWFDHRLMNDHVGVPTCEVLAHHLAAYMKEHTKRESVIGYGGSKDVDIVSVMVKVREGEGGWACVTL